MKISDVPPDMMAGYEEMMEEYYHTLYDRADRVVDIAALLRRVAAESRPYNATSLREAAEQLDEIAQLMRVHGEDSDDCEDDEDDEGDEHDIDPLS